MLRLQGKARTSDLRAGMALALVLGACAATTPEEPHGVALWFAGLSSASCTVTGSGSGNVPDDVATLAVSLTWPGAQPKIERTSRASVQGKAGWLIKLPVTSGLDIEAYGCDANKNVIWMGRSNGFAIESQKETQARVFLAPVGKLACASSVGGSGVLQAPRSLAGGVGLASGDAAIVGGVKDWIDAGANRKTGAASTATDFYDHRAGVFQKGPDLLVPRIQPHVFALPAAPGEVAATRVLVIGGSGSVASVSSKALPTPFMAPDAVDAASLPKLQAEVLDMAGGSASKSTAYTGDVGVGWRAFSSGILAGEDIVLVGGVDDSGAALAIGTRIQKIADIAAGGSSQNAQITLVTARAQPALATFADGTVLVWGGATSKASADMGELIAPGETGGRKLTVTGPAELLGSDALATVGPAAVVLARTADSLTLLVSGGMSVSHPTLGVDTLSYAVTVSRTAQTAELKLIKLPTDIALHAGRDCATAQLPGGQVLFAGGLIAPSSTAQPYCKPGGECILDTYTVFDPPADLTASVLEMNATVVKFDGQRFGMTVLPVPAGVLLAGGQTTVFLDGPALLDVGALLAWAPSADIQAKVCGK